MRGAALGAAVGVVALAVTAAGCASTPHYVPPAHTYYVAADGNDASDGTAPDSAWRTLERAERTKLEPGDRLLLEGGTRFRGSVTVGRDEAGDAARPVVIGSFGTGRATVVSVAEPAVSVHDTSGVQVRDLLLRGSRASRAHDAGVNLYSDLRDGSRPAGITVSGVDVSGFRVGLAVGASPHGVGFRDVTVRQSVLHGNKDAGLLTYGPDYKPARDVYAHEDLTLDSVAAYGNQGDPTAHDRHTGDGIVVGSVRGATLRHVDAHDNGARAASDAPEGPVGVWTYDATRVVIEESVSYRNHTGSTVDGAGFGLDSNVSHSALRRNLAFDNDGPGFYAYQRWQNGAHAHNTISHNISADDGRALPEHGALAVYGTDIHELAVVQNTVLLSLSPAGPGPALRLQPGEHGVAVRNNLFVTEGVPLVFADPGLTRSDVVLQGNDYRSVEGGWQVGWGADTYGSLTAWREGTGQEMAGGQATGLDVDPCLAGGALPAILSVADAPRTIPYCPALAAQGVELPLPDQAPAAGSVDYFGRTVTTPPQVGAVIPR
ncbi:right-handed parallel beta-helix repeat-containing protein [Streptomyces sp. NPDC052225]|uniref:right-handed parallel beta-helix repeat-containing protein n=1 Tax=Streptomyces sp. NPDC052225 TaxID=3154949 RepID=UPI00342516DE